MYEVEFRPRAAHDFEKLDGAVAARVLKKLRWLADNFESIEPEPLAGPLAGLFKIRVGDYRIVYQFSREKKTLTIWMLGHRREIYSKPA